MGNINDRYAIVGVGESKRSRNSGTTPLHLALDASRSAIKDAGIEATDIDGFMNYNENDSCTSHQLATYLGVRPKYVKDIQGGGSSTEMLIGDAIALIEAGMLNTVLIYRSMNGSSGHRVGRGYDPDRSEEHTSELQSRGHVVCRLLLEKKKENNDERKHLLILFVLRVGQCSTLFQYQLTKI